MDFVDCPDTARVLTSRVHGVSSVADFSVVKAGAELHGCTIGRLCIVCEGAVIGAGAVIADMAYVAQNVQIGPRSQIGVRCNLLQRAKIGARVTIGVGCTVFSDVTIGDGALIPNAMLITKPVHIREMLNQDGKTSGHLCDCDEVVIYNAARKRWTCESCERVYHFEGRDMLLDTDPNQPDKE